MKCDDCEWTQAELLHQTQLREILESRLYQVAQQLHHQVPEETPNEALQQEAQSLRVHLAWMEKSRDWYRAELRQAQAEASAPIARQERLAAVLETEAAWATLTGAGWCLP